MKAAASGLGLRSYGQIIGFGWREKRKGGGLWILLITALGLLCWGAGVWTGQQDDKTAGAVWVLVSIAFLWVFVSRGLLRQNQLWLARLVPAHLQGLRQVLLIAGVCTAALLATLAAALAGVNLSVAWVASALLTAVVAGWARWFRIAGLVALVIVLLVALTQFQLLLTLPQLAQRAPLLSSAFALVVLLLNLNGLIGANGSFYAKALRAAQLRHRGHRGYAADAKWYTAWFGWPYRTLLRLLSTPRSPALSRLMLGLGPGAHWADQVGSLLMFFVMAVLWGDLRNSSSLHRPVTIGWPEIMTLSLALMLVMGQAKSLQQRYMRTSREQALLMLLPGVPQGRALNLALIRLNLLRFGLMWAAVAALTVAVPVSTGFSAMLHLYVVASLASLAELLGDWSRIGPAGQRNPSQLRWWFTSPFVLSGLAMLIQQALSLPIFASYGLLVLASLTLIAHRLRIQLNAPAAFPVGRLA